MTSHLFRAIQSHFQLLFLSLEKKKTISSSWCGWGGSNSILPSLQRWPVGLVKTTALRVIMDCLSLFAGSGRPPTAIACVSCGWIGHLHEEFVASRGRCWNALPFLVRISSVSTFKADCLCAVVTYIRWHLKSKPHTSQSLRFVFSASLQCRANPVTFPVFYFSSS